MLSQRAQNFLTSIKQHFYERDHRNDKEAKRNAAPSSADFLSDRDTWERIEKLASTASQIQIATHIFKGIHSGPTIREATNIRVGPEQLPARHEVGSHALRTKLLDATGNSAVLPTFALLRHEILGRSLLDWLLADDPDAIAALAPDSGQARNIANALLETNEPRCSPRTHTKGKQVYWQVGGDPQEDSDFHLLAPLYPSVLAHTVHQRIDLAKFSEASKGARTAKKNGIFSEFVVHEYDELAILNLGGTKAQNIGQLNSERGGRNYLLFSMPPIWTMREIRPLLKAPSAFNVFGRRKTVRALTQEFRSFLNSNPPSNIDTRNRVADLVDQILSELVQFAAALRALEAGWTNSPDCWLSAPERAWLDSYSTTGDGWLEPVASMFANWVNAALRDPLPMGNAEFLTWRKAAMEQLVVEG